MPITGTLRRVTLAKSFGKYSSRAETRKTSAIVNCQLVRQPAQASAIRAMTNLPISGQNIVAKTRPKGAVECERSSLSTMPKLMLLAST